MKGVDGSYGVWDVDSHPNTLQRQPSKTEADLDKQFKKYLTKWFGKPIKVENSEGADWINQRGLTGRLRFTQGKEITTKSGRTRPQFQFEDYTDDVNCSKQFQDYCASTTLHGYRYISEPKRTYAERLFWACWCIFGLVSACYMMSKIWTKWAKNPVLTSVATTNYPVTSVIFPAVTICTVNKAVTEKLIIQGCRYNYTLSQMKTIISILVDPDARNNDHFNAEKITVKPETVLKYLRLVAPKCDDYLLTCKWNSNPVPCKHIFRLTLTDSGYCCTFNAVETKTSRKDSKYDLEVMTQEAEFEYLQKAVWDYTDNFRTENGGLPQGEIENFTNPVDNFNCIREYDDDLFPGICVYLQRCRESPTCQLKNRPQVSPGQSTEDPDVPGLEYGSASNPQYMNIFQEGFPFRVAGAGESRGLTLMLDTLRCDSVPTDSFKGLRILVHNAGDFPAVDERGYIIGPGMETQIGVTAIETYSASSLTKFSSETRGCFFPHEFPLKFYTEYSRSACVVECETEFIGRECHCSQYFSPGNYSACTLKQHTECVRTAVDVIQKKTVPVPVSKEEETSIFKFKSKSAATQEKSCDFPNQPQANQTKMIREAIEQGHTHLNDIAYVSGSISVVQVFFRESSIMQYKRDELFTWEDFVSNLGGVLSLCLGFSLLSLVEVIYFFTMRMSIDKKREMSNRSQIHFTGS